MRISDWSSDVCSSDLIDIQQTLKSKIDVDFRPYTILGACNPSLAHEALQLEDKVGLMLPCNVIVQQSGSDDVEVAAIDPVASMQAITNPGLLKAADTVREKRSEEHTSELQSLMRISYAVFCLKKHKIT